MPYASAEILGNYLAPKLNGIVEFYPWLDGTLVKVEVANLPPTREAFGGSVAVGPFFAFHIHAGGSCGDASSKFESSMGHYNPTNQQHPLHAGDLPVLLSNNGYAFMTVYTNRFKPSDIIGKTVIIHLHADDYATQPSGNAGERIGCGGIIKK